MIVRRSPANARANYCCHPERSEGPRLCNEILRVAQDDSLLSGFEWASRVGGFGSFGKLGTNAINLIGRPRHANLQMARRHTGIRRSRAGGNQASFGESHWFPACAGTTNLWNIVVTFRGLCLNPTRPPTPPAAPSTQPAIHAPISRAIRRAILVPAAIPPDPRR